MAKTVKSGLMAKYGSKLDQAVQAHAEDETTYGRIQLPPGINNGVAQLVECKFDVYKSGQNEGEYYFRAAGVVMEPAVVHTKDGDIVVRGQQTSIMIPVCGTKTQGGKETTQQEHVADILNEMRRLGAKFSAKGGASQLEQLAEGLKQVKPFFKFTTSLRKARTKDQTDGVWENWHGTNGLEDYVPPEEEFVNDENEQVEVEEPEEVEEVEEEAKPAKSAPKTKPVPTKNPPQPPKKAPPKAPEPEPEDEPEGFTEFGDLDSLVEQADKPGKAGQPARDKLNDWAVQLGATEEEVNDAANWGEVADMIRNGSGNTETEQEPEEEQVEEEEEQDEWVPEQGSMVQYKPQDPKTKRPVKTPVDCEVTAINSKKKTVTLKNHDDGKSVYKDVPWDDLVVGN